MKTVIFRTLRACLVMALVSVTACQGDRIDRSGQTGGFMDHYAKRLAEVSNLPGSVTGREPGLIRVSVPQERSIYFFTLPGHPAHPAIVRQSVIDRDGDVYVEIDGWSDRPSAAMEDWMRAFQQQSENLRRQFQ